MVTPSPGAQQWSMKLEFMCQEQATGCTVVMNALAVTLRISSPWTLAPFVAWLRAGPDQAPLVSLHFALVGKTELKRSVNSSFFSLSIQKLAVISH